MNFQDKKNKKTEPLAVRKVNQKIREFKMGSYAYDFENPHEKEVMHKHKLQYILRTFYMFLVAILFNFGVIVFLQKSETIPSGLSGIPMLITLVWTKLKPYFAVLYLVSNIPLFLIFWRKTKLSFSLHTLEFMLFQIVINFLLTIGGENSVAAWSQKVFNIAPGWEQVIEVIDKNNGTKQLFENSITWPILANGLIGSVFVGVSISLAWKFGGSTGGTDIIAYYFSTKKQKSVSWMLSVFAIGSTIIFLIIFSFARRHLPTAKIIYLADGTQHYQMINQRVVIGMRELTTFVYIIVVNGLISVLYPKYKKVNVEISCGTSFARIIEYFKEIKYWHAYSIFTTQSGYTGEKVYKINTTMLLLETKNIIKDLRAIDQKVWISIKPTYQIHGSFNTHYVDQN
ncbi:YitT family protein [Mycoplasmopsis phocirhinis]|uniref:YitT family protein n=1 Tax=Mycoplasmopsis phocirhinis TaxID=142650 RepID=A0A4P6MPA2_9BACT|nr:YitT family protein [Mycoplasmopsis phocirhinis]QBF34923.1 YitT family protein [Mycoplasmopsis phocirhinis]